MEGPPLTEPEVETEAGESATSLARKHLERALEADRRPLKQYHIRAALQALLIEEGGERGWSDGRSRP
ncbi:MAG: hypothetical protein ABEJ40_10225 [Haloarculaceae archaeon]